MSKENKENKIVFKSLKDRFSKKNKQEEDINVTIDEPSTSESLNKENIESNSNEEIASESVSDVSNNNEETDGSLTENTSNEDFKTEDSDTELNIEENKEETEYLSPEDMLSTRNPAVKKELEKKLDSLVDYTDNSNENTQKDLVLKVTPEAGEIPVHQVFSKIDNFYKDPGDETVQEREYTFELDALNENKEDEEETQTEETFDEETSNNENNEKDNLTNTSNIEETALEETNDYEKLREKYKNDFNSFINKMENGNNTIHFRTTDARERMTSNIEETALKETNDYVEDTLNTGEMPELEDIEISENSFSYEEDTTSDKEYLSKEEALEDEEQSVNDDTDNDEIEIEEQLDLDFVDDTEEDILNKNEDILEITETEENSEEYVSNDYETENLENSEYETSEYDMPAENEESTEISEYSYNTDTEEETQEEDGYDDDIMGDLLSLADEQLNSYEEGTEEEIDPEQTYEEESQEEETQYEQEEVEENEEPVEGEEDVLGDTYSEEEIESLRKGSNRNKKDLIIKISVGALVLILLVATGLFVRNLMNDKTEKDKTPEPATEVEVNLPEEEPQSEIDAIPEEVIEDAEESSTEDALSVEGETANLEESDSTSSLFMQTYEGYIVDINDDSIFVSSDMTDEQLVTLATAFNNFTGIDADLGVTVEAPAVEEKNPNAQMVDSAKDVTVYVYSQGTTYHADKECQNDFIEDDLIEMKLSEALSMGKTKCSECAMNVDENIYVEPETEETEETTEEATEGDAGETNPEEATLLAEEDQTEEPIVAYDVKDFDYTEETSLSSILYKKFTYEDLSVIPSWATIGSKVSVTYLQDKETTNNDVIEISKADDSANTDFDVEGGIDFTDSAQSNMFGSDFEAIVATINDRRRTETGTTTKDNPLELLNLSEKEAVTASVSISSASIVWFQIGWKKNSDTKDVPSLEDVTVELKTPNGSLINESNIDQYGKMWIDKSLINFVLKNAEAGDWGVMFTKNVGTYLGDVTINALPLSGFLQIDKADAKYSDGKLSVIWQCVGVPDDNCKVEIYARKGTKDVLLYGGNSIDDNIHIIDMVDIDTKKIAGNTYDIVIRITDIDATASTPKNIKASFVTDEMIISNVEIPSTTVAPTDNSKTSKTTSTKK